MKKMKRLFCFLLAFTLTFGCMSGGAFAEVETGTAETAVDDITEVATDDTIETAADATVDVAADDTAETAADDTTEAQKEDVTDDTVDDTAGATTETRKEDIADVTTETTTDGTADTATADIVENAITEDATEAATYGIAETREAPTTEAVNLYVGESIEFHDLTGDYSATDLSSVNASGVATVSVTGNQVVQQEVQLGTDATFNGNMVDATSCLYTFTAVTDEANTYYISAQVGDTTVYLDTLNNIKPNSSGQTRADGTEKKVKVSVKTVDNNPVFTLLSMGGGGSAAKPNAFVHFYKNNNRYFDRCGTVDTDSGHSEHCFELYKQFDNAPADSPIQGYAKISSLNEIENGGQYLIVIKANDNNYYLMHPADSNNSSAQKYDFVAKLGPASGYHTDITITAVGGGATSVQIGNKLYDINVTGFDKSRWVATACSEMPGTSGDANAMAAIDGNTGSWWHTNYNGGDDHVYGTHWIKIDFNKELTFDTFIYTGRGTGGNGSIKDYKLELLDETGNVTKTFTGTFSATNVTSEVDLRERVTAHGIRLTAVTTHNGQNYAAAVEIDISDSLLLRKSELKTKLQGKINECNNIEYIYTYTQKSAQALQDSLAAANTIYNDENATKEQLWQASVNLKNAKDGLEKVAVLAENCKQTFTVTALYQDNAHSSDKLINGNQSDFWESPWDTSTRDDAALPQTIDINLNGSYDLERLEIIKNSGNNGRLRKYQVKVSTDNGTTYKEFTEVDTPFAELSSTIVIDTKGVTNVQVIAMDATTASGEGHDGADYVRIAEINFYGTKAGWDKPSDYIDASGNKTAPTKEGYVFAGWYTSDTKPTMDTALKQGDEMPEYAYAKFVNKNVLGVASQITLGTNTESPSTKLRLVTSVDNLQYRSIGFDVTYSGRENNPHDFHTRNVYKTLTGYVNEETRESYTPQQTFSSDANYFAAFIVTVNSKLFDKQITVTPKWTTLDGTEVKGDPVPITITRSASFATTP